MSSKDKGKPEEKKPAQSQPASAAKKPASKGKYGVDEPPMESHKGKKGKLHKDKHGRGTK